MHDFFHLPLAATGGAAKFKISCFLTVGVRTHCYQLNKITNGNEYCSSGTSS
ncbi:hypothetical protein WN55_11129 [Dufourea novaeangliae]|uniref:Uncharacterized protein n=1 Tax=Dufourea novaeangliae TaxID=178035 RepID=A0A154PBW6_DUFNO|nr:hypothetical protein WN55_11129 [Dufourea novaeangliae]